MTIFDDLQKLLLYQRLNLGFECEVCKRKFFNRLDHLQHISSCCKREQLKCEKCGKTFAHQKILDLHMRFHNLSLSVNNSPESEATVASGGDDQPPQSKEQLQNSSNEFESFQTLSGTQSENALLEPKVDNVQLLRNQSSHRVRVKRKTVAKKQVGLTKIRMEDCLRCDACSCIYIDPKDYYKHMRNFHQVDVDNSPIQQQRPKKNCRSCCRQCRGVQCRGVKKPRATQLASNLIFQINMSDNIKDRWSRMVSQQLSECPIPEISNDPTLEEDIKPDLDAIAIKPDPDSSIDLSHLLSQVEVKIKTEPPDDFPMYSS